MILVTSGLGFIGSHLTHALLEGGHHVLATTHSRRQPVSFLSGREGLTVAQLDVLDQDQWDELGSRFQVDAVVHLVATHGVGDPLDDLAADLRGFANAIRFARSASVSRLVYASSIGVYAGVEPPYLEDMPLPPLAPHGVAAAKKSLELAADLARNSGAVELVGLRIGGAWGPLGNPTSRFIGLPRLLHAAIAGKPLHLDADVSCDLIYIEDAAQAIVSVLTTPKLNHSIYNIGSGSVVSDQEVADAIRQLIPRASLSISPDAPRYHVGPLNIDKLAADTGFTPRITTQDGLKTYTEWLRTAAR
ncbi:NAD-dependent epimerase/dehydratase family protein [Leifsonia sp. SIMBA_070]|uniref:NAD-dependent epimerase/dehydratase family protein n=3 Tax=Bacillati TaxID=1783272 RepID=UPI00397C8A05